MKSIDQTRFLATNYLSLQGLRSIPLGLCFLLTCLWANSLFGIGAKDFTLPIVFVLGAALIYVLIDEYYKRTFGEVKRTLSARRMELILTIVLGTLAIGAFWVNISFELPFTPLGLVFAVVFLVDYPKANFPLNKLSVIKLVFSTCLVMLSILPLYSGIHWWNAFGIKSALLGISILFSVLAIAAGVIWHIYFINSLPAAEVKDG